MKEKAKKVFSTTAVWICAVLLAGLLGGCAAGAQAAAEAVPPGLGNGWKTERSMDLLYAENFSVDYYEGGYALIRISDGSRFLIVPEGGDVPEGIDEDIVVLKQPVDEIYLVATSAMCLFDALDSLGNIAMSGTQADGWYVAGAKEAMEKGDIVYAGKYNKPDYERILANGCKLALESTMINHTPEVKEKLQELGIPVLVEQSSFEKHPLGAPNGSSFME